MIVDKACSVTVVGSRRRVDVSLSSSVPVAELLWDLVDLLDEPEPEGGAGGWGLVRVGGRPLDAERGLAAQGVTDGSLLFLRDLGRPLASPAVDDYAEAVALAVDARGGRWTAGVRQGALVAVALAWMLLGAGVALRIDEPGVRAGTALGAAAVLLVCGVLVARRFGHLATGALVGLGALPFWAVGGLGAALLMGLGGPWLYPAVAGFVTAGALVALLTGDRARAPVAGVASALGLPAAVAAVCLALGAGPLQMAAVLAPLLLIELRLMPRLAVRLARLGGARSFDPAALRPRVESGHGLLAAMVIGAATVMAAACLLLALYGGAYERALVAALAVGAATHVRQFRFALEAAPLALAALVGLSALELAALRGLYAVPGLRPAVVGLALATALALVGLGVAGRRRQLSPQLRRRLGQLEALAVVTSIPLAAGALGAYSAVAALAHSLA